MSKTGKKYQSASSQIEAGRRYSIKDAIELLKKMPQPKFDQSVELHLKLGIDMTQANQQVRGSVMLPYGTGKVKKIAVFCGEEKAKEAKEAGASLVGGEELIKQIGQTGKCDFEVAIATPEMMKKMASIAKILGQKGLMPNPKTETITNDIGKTIKEMNTGKINYRVDDSGNIHQIVGKLSFDTEKLQKNIEVLLEAIKHAKPSGVKGTYIRNVVLTTTMGPGVPLAI